MGTRSVIGIVNKQDKTITSVYCHWDGYPEHHLTILKNFYNTEEKVRELISYGDMSELDTTLNTCVFYHRDRKESKEDTMPTQYSSVISWKHAYRQNVDYFYLFTEDDVWEYSIQ
jgi:hypothetical protein